MGRACRNPSSFSRASEAESEQTSSLSCGIQRCWQYDSWPVVGLDACAHLSGHGLGGFVLGCFDSAVRHFLRYLCSGCWDGSVVKQASRLLAQLEMRLCLGGLDKNDLGIDDGDGRLVVVQHFTRSGTPAVTETHPFDEPISGLRV